ncbi:MAG: tripartite tricarboxylate transporter TctB family protein [Gammaproteobacteria bacterium]|nr:tripartite tricarboxylate transporter TctB family protein [Gammaproteobacteria bacterium]
MAYLLVIGFCILMLSWGIPNYTPAYPGYGASSSLVPSVAISIMLFMACLSLFFVFIARYFKKPLPRSETTFPEDRGDEGGFTQIGRVNLRCLMNVMFPSVLLIVAIEYVGYIIASFVFLMLLQYVIGSRRWLQSIMLAVILTAVLYVIMRYGFGVPVPGPQLFE